MEPSDPRHYLMQLASDRGASLSSLSALIGRNTTYLQQFVRKGSPRKLEEGDRQTLARFFGVSEAALGGSEDKYLPTAAKSRVAQWLDIPRLNIDASAGPGAVAGGEAAIGAFRFAASWLRAQGLNAAMLSAIAVSGDSMQNTLYDGDEILVDRTPRIWQNGVHVVRLGDALLVKRLDLTRPDRVTLISDNAAYPKLDLPPAELVIIGRVAWKCGRL